MTIVNDGTRVITKLETSLTDDARVVIYDLNMFIVQATDLNELFQFRSYQKVQNILILGLIASFIFVQVYYCSFLAWWAVD
jgi:hypothetical protein